MGEMAEREGFESSVKRKPKYLQSTDGTRRPLKYTMVQLNGLQMDCNF